MKPPFLYRAVREEACALRFVNQGIVPLTNIKLYRSIEDRVRQDPEEGIARYLEPMEGRPAAEPSDLIMNTRTTFNSVLALCMSAPDIEPKVLLAFGSHVIRINEPDTLCRDLKEYFQSGPPGTRGSVELCKVTYSKGEQVDPSLDERGRHRLTYSQKSVRHEAEREWRIVLIARDDHHAVRAVATLGKRLEYCELLPNYRVNPAAGGGLAAD